MPCCCDAPPSYLSKLCGYIFNVICLGFFTSLCNHNNAQCSWKEGLTSDDSVSVFNLFLGVYFSLHVLTWYIVFVYLYNSVIAVALDYLLPCMNLTYQYERFVVYSCELLFGYWAAGEILGGWCDLERIGDCVQNDTGDCQSFFITWVTQMTQTLCERITSDYDADRSAFIRKPTSMCVYTFRYMGHFIMTSLSTFLAPTKIDAIADDDINDRSQARLIHPTMREKLNNPNLEYTL